MVELVMEASLVWFFLMYLGIYLIAYFVVFKNWEGKKLRPEASSCLISFAHGTPAVVLASLAIFLGGAPYGLALENTEFQNVVLEYSIAYFLMDLAHYLVFFPSDVLFIGHHLATLFVFVTCRYVVCSGGVGILVLLVLAEVTSFCQNTWTLTSARRGDSESARRIYEVLSPPFYVFYSVVRGVVGPLFVWEMGRFYFGGGAEGVIPRWLWVSWMVVVVTAIGVSILWIANLWVELIKDRNENRLVEKKLQ